MGAVYEGGDRVSWRALSCDLSLAGRYRSHLCTRTGCRSTSLKYRLPARHAEVPEGISAFQLEGFFEGWPNPPSTTTPLEILHRSFAVELAVTTDSEQVVGFINVLSDGLLSAYVPLLEVKGGYRGRGIGSQLVRRMLLRLGALYVIDIVCDPKLVPFYTSLGLRPGRAMCHRNYSAQSGLS